MSDVFGDTIRGSFKVMRFEAGEGLIKFPKEISIPGSCAFVSGVSIRKNEKKAIIQCFNSVNHVYAFGADPESSMYSCSVAVFGASCERGGFKSSTGLGKLLDSYKSNRVSKSAKTLSLTVDNKVLKGILVGVAVDVVDAELNLFRVMFMFNDLDS